MAAASQPRDAALGEEGAEVAVEARPAAGVGAGTEPMLGAETVPATKTETRWTEIDPVGTEQVISSIRVRP